ncbi:MAG TPA: hypothetical protein VFJ43_14640 [Bacteroidia bacterium]|nr:hypothetical protein [Bacteroidia bacterium]
MNKRLTLILVLFLPILIYIYFALGVPKAFRAPFFGPRHTIQVTDKNGNPKTDTAYWSIPEFTFLTSNGQRFNSKTLDGNLYIALFVNPDSMKSTLPIFAEDIQLNRMSYNYGRFVFFYPGDSAGNPMKDAPDFAKEMKLGVDTAYTVILPPVTFDSLHDKQYFVPDPSRKKDPWATWSDAVLIDHKGRIRGYYNIRYAAELKKMKEDIRFIKFRDEAAETLDQSKVEQKKK